MLSRNDIIKLEKYKKGSTFNDEESSLVEDAASLGLLKFSYIIDETESVIGTAKLTPFGARLLDRRKDLNSFKRYLIRFIDFLYR